MMPLMLVGGRVIDPLSELDGLYDVIIVDGAIEAIEPSGKLPTLDGSAVIRCNGLWVAPGLIDPHVHLRDPGFPEKETIASGLRAAAAGGFTAVAAMANTSPVNDTPAITEYMTVSARDAHAARLIPVSAVTRGLAGRELVDFAAMSAAGARMFSDDGHPIDDEVVLSNALHQTREHGYAISLHEEDRSLTANRAMNAGDASKILGVAGMPASAETARVRRDLAIAMGAGAAVHIAHASLAESLELVRAARKRGAEVTCEVTPHHFTLDDRAVLEWGPNARMMPPLRALEDVTALQAGLADGTVDIIATDHAPHDPVSKAMDRIGTRFERGRVTSALSPEEAEALSCSANGIVGLETALGLALQIVHRGLITPSRLVELMSLNPARLLRLERHGTLAVGGRADITLIDPNREWTVEPEKSLSRSRNTPFAGMTLRGKALVTIVGGEIVHDARGGEGRP